MASASVTFEQVYERWRWYVSSALVRTVPYFELDDAMQEVFFKAWRGMQSREVTLEGARPWLASIIQHYRIDRHRRALTHPDSIELQDASVEPEDSDIESYIAELPEREAIVLRLWLDGYTVQEIAELQGKSWSIVREIRRSALRRLRNCDALELAEK